MSALAPAQAALPARPAMSADGWVQTLSCVVLILTFVYVVFGIPGQDLTDTRQTDRVSPYNSLIWLVLLALSVPVLIRQRRDVAALLLSCWPLLLLFAYFGLSASWALDPSASFRRFMFTLVQLAIFTSVVVGIRRAPTIHTVIAATCAASAVADLLYWLAAPGAAMTSEGFGGLQQQKNQAGLLMMLGCLSAATCLWLLRERRGRRALAAPLVVMVVLLLATRSSTSAAVTFAAAIVMPALLAVSRLRGTAGWAILASLAFAVTFGLVIYLAYSGLTGRDPWLPLRGVTFTARTDIWRFVMHQIAQRPLVGAGYSSFWSINPAVQPSLKSGAWFGTDSIINEAHNGYLDLLATTGIIGLIGGLFVLFRTIALAALAMVRAEPAEAAWRSGDLARPTAVFYLALTLGLVVHNFTESNLFSNNGVLAVALLIAVLDLEKWRLRRRRAA